MNTMASMGSRAVYANPRDEQRMKKNHTASGDYPKSGPTSTAWLHKKQMEILKGNQGNLARDYREPAHGEARRRKTDQRSHDQ